MKRDIPENLLAILVTVVIVFGTYAVVDRICDYVEATTWKEAEIERARNAGKDYWKGLANGLRENE